MSYADVAASGPKQSDAEKYAPASHQPRVRAQTDLPSRRMPDAVPEIQHDDSGVHSLDSLSSSGPNSVPSYADQQLAEERAQKARAEAERFADRTATQASEFEKHAQQELRRMEKQAGKKYEEFSREAKQQYESWKKEASKDSREAGKKAKKAEKWAEENKGNPVVVGNAVVIAALGGLLGYGAYRSHQQGTLTPQLVGLWAGAVGLFAVGDYYVSQFLFKKYPPKN